MQQHSRRADAERAQAGSRNGHQGREFSDELAIKIARDLGLDPEARDGASKHMTITRKRRRESGSKGGADGAEPDSPKVLVPPAAAAEGKRWRSGSGR